METKEKALLPIGEGFWNIRGSFKLLVGLIELGTHMSVIRLSNGKFLLIDAIPITDQIKSEIDELTNKGEKIEAVITTHPYHTLAIPGLHETYPNPPYYGCPRHVSRFPQIKWAGDLADCHVRNKWNPDVEIRIPEGSEFVNPLPPKTNHFSCAFVFHRGSGTIHVDDTIIYSQNPGFLLRMAGFKEGSMMFHPSIKGPGLLPNPEAPFQFRDWVSGILKDWEFDNICTAHLGNKIGGAKEQIGLLLKSAEPLFQKLADKRKDSKYVPVETPAQTVSGEECG